MLCNEDLVINRILDWWSRVGLQIRLQILIQGSLFVILVVAQLWISKHLEQQGLTDVEARAKSVATSAINGSNSQFKTLIK